MSNLLDTAPQKSQINIFSVFAMTNERNIALSDSGQVYTEGPYDISE